MDSSRRLVVGGGVGVTAGLVFARESIAWVISKALDRLLAIIGPSVRNSTAFSWLDVLGFILVIAGEFFITLGLRKRPSTTHASTPSVTGNTLPATGVLSDPPPFDLKRFYVGQILVSAERMGQMNTISIGVRVFNATNRTLYIQNVEGCITLIEKRLNPRKFKLDPPRDPEFNDTDCSIDGHEFLIRFDQSLTEEIIMKISSIREENRVDLDFEGLNIRMRAAEQAGTFRLPVWDRLTLSRDEKLRAGRIKLESN